MRKRGFLIFVGFVGACVVAVALAGCTGRAKKAAGGNGRIRVLATFLPMYIFTENVAQGAKNVQVDVLIGVNVGEPHDYQLSPADAKKITESDALIANGRIEQFLGDAVRRVNPRIVTFVSSDGLPLIADAATVLSQNANGAPNPHTWVAPSQAALQVARIRDFLIKLDPAETQLFTANADKYIRELNALRGELASAARALPKKRIVTFHDAFDYFAKDAGLEIAGYVEGTPGQDPSAGEIAALVSRIKSAGADAVYSEPQYPAKVAELVSRESGVPVASLDPMETTELADPPLDLYQQVMRKNLKTLQDTLGK